MSKKQTAAVKSKVWDLDQPRPNRSEILNIAKDNACDVAGVIPMPTPPIDLYLGELNGRLEALDKTVAILAERTGPFRTPDRDNPPEPMGQDQKTMSNIARMLSDYSARLGAITQRLQTLSATIEI